MELLTIKEFAAIVRYTDGTIRNKVCKGEINSQLVGNKRLIPKEELNKFYTNKEELDKFLKGE